MTTPHCFKKVAKPEARKADKPRTVVEQVKKYGDKWALLSGTGVFARAHWSNVMADWPHDQREYYDMVRMERGQKCRCGE